MRHKSLQLKTSKAIRKLLYLVFLIAGIQCASAQIIISGYLANPGGTDSPYEYVQLVASQNINFATTNYSVVWANNGTATAAGWIAGGSVTYGFNLTSGSVTAGQTFYVGGTGKLIDGVGSTDISSANWIRAIATGTSTGDGFGNLNTSGVMGNGGSSADAIAIFSGLTSSLTNSTVPIDAIFYGAAIGSAFVSTTTGYQLPTNNGIYPGGKLQTTSTFFGDPAGDTYYKLTGTYNANTSTWTVPRTLANSSSVTLTSTSPLSAIASNITVISCVAPTLTPTVTNVSCNGFADGAVALSTSGGSSPFTYSWKNSLNAVVATTQNLSGVGPDTYTVTVTATGGCTSSASATVTQPAPLSTPTADNSISFSTISQTGFSISSSGTGGTGRVIKINTANSFTSPANNSSPSANTTYSGSGEQVVFNGTGTSVNVTGLVANTTYYVASFAFNGTATCRAYNTTPFVNNQTTQAATSPLIVVSGTINPFNSTAGVPSLSQSYQVSGSNLLSDISITTSSPFEISLSSGSGFGTSLTLTQSGGSVSSTTVYIRINSASSGTFSGTVANASSSATTQNVSVSGTILDYEPVGQSAIAANTPTATSINVTTSANTGSGRIIVASLSPITYVPADGIPASGVNSNFSSATDYSGNRIVYSGAGNSVSVTGLASSTTYYFASFEYNGSGATINYNSTAPNSTSLSTIAAEPTIAAGTISFTRVKTDTLVLSFAGGNGSQRIVVINENAAVTFSPQDGVTYTGVDSNYTAATDQGGGRILYSGTATTLTVGGVSRGKTYNVRVYEFNGSATTRNYLTTTFGSGSVNTPDYIPYTSGTYSQDFNGLPINGLTYTTTNFGPGPYYLSTPPVNATNIAGWQYWRSAGTGADVRFFAENGSGTTGGAMSYGTDGSTERALGSLATGAVIPAVGATLVNNSSSTYTSVTINFTGEQWRVGGSGAANTLTFGYALGSSGISSGTFTSISALNFSSPNLTGTNSVNGNSANNKITATATFALNGNWAPGQTLSIKWTDANDAGNDDGLAVDDFTFSATGPSAPLAQDHDINFSNILPNSLTSSWTNGDGLKRIVVINTTNTFTTPVNGTTYTADTNYTGAGEQVVYNGTGSSVNIAGLAGSTTYYVHVFAYNGTGVTTTYNTSNAVLNPNSATTAAPVLATHLVLVNLNNGVDVEKNNAFSITVQSYDDNNLPHNVLANTTITITKTSGTGVLSGTLTGVILAGTNSTTISGLLYNKIETITLLASASGGDPLTAVSTGPFDVHGVASDLSFSNVPANGIINTVIAPFQVLALRSDDGNTDVYYNGSVTITSSGPGVMSGTLTQPAINGVATFNDIQFSANGNYTLQASSGSLTHAFSPQILINPPVAVTELVIPKYLGSKTTASTNNASVPFAICLQIDNLSPNTLYNVSIGLALTSEASTSMGAGNIWSGTSFNGQTKNGAFVSSANGSSGPQWFFLQPTGNATRFEAGAQHNIRLAFSSSSFSGTIVPNYVGAKFITALDIASTPRTAATTDDGAFLTASFQSCVGGKYILTYDNVSGTGDPLYSFQASPLIASQGSKSELPATVDNFYQNLSPTGSFAGILPIGANNPNGVRRFEARNADNTIFSYQTDNDGIWPSGANTTTNTRRSVTAFSATDATLSTITVTSTSTNVTCYGNANGSVTATPVTNATPVSYVWTPGLSTDNPLLNIGPGNYSVVATDANSCTATSSSIVTQPTQIQISGVVTNTSCSGGNTGAIDISVTGGAGGYSYSWSNSSTTEDISGLGVGTYSVTVTDLSGCTNSATFNIVSVNPNPSLTVSANPTSICPGSSSVLTASGADSYTWSPSASLNATTGSSVIATPASSTVYTVNGLDGFGCQSSATVSVTVYAAPVVAVSPVTSQICQGTSVSLVATGGATYSWSPSAGLNSTSGSTVMASPASTTVYTVTGSDSHACTATATATVNVRVTALPVVSSPVSYCLNATASPLTATALSGYQLVYYSSAMGGTGSTTAPTPSTSTAGSTNYYVSQQVVNPGLAIAITGRNNGGSPDVFSFVALSNIAAGTVIYFTDNGWATTGFRGATTTDGNGSEDLVKWTAINPISAGTVINSYVSTANYAWTITGAIAGLTTQYAALSLSASGDQIYAFTSTAATNPLFNTAQITHLYVFDDTNGFEEATTSATGNIPPGLTSGINANSLPFISTPVVGLINDNQSRTISEWYTYISSSSNYTTTTSTTSNIIVDFGCESQRAVITVNVNALPVVSISADSIACNGGTTTVNVTGSGTVSPYNGGGTFVVGAGNYSYTITDGNTCSNSGSLSLGQPAAIIISNVNPSSACPGTEIIITGSNLSDITSVSFNGASATPSIISSTEIHVIVPALASSGIPVFSTSAGCTANAPGSFTVTTCNTSLGLTMKLFLQGYYNGGGAMQPVLFNEGITSNTDVTDTILVELRDDGDHSLVIDQATGLLMTDGSVSLSFSNAMPSVPYWVVINHRNTLQTWSATTIMLNSSTAPFIDLTSSASAAFGNNMIDVYNEGIFSLFTGDINQDQSIDPFDFPAYDSDNLGGVFGVYVSSDFNGDGSVDPFDFPVFDQNNLAGVYTIIP